MEKNIINIDAHVIDDIRTIITRARSKAYQSINETLIRSNWEIGKRIVEEEQLGKQRADYGIQLIKSISQQLTTEFGSGYGVRNLAYFKQLYQYFPDWEILHARVQNLTWTHLKSILRVTDAEARLWYLKESSEQMWSTRTLDRNVASQYYYRLLQTSNEHKDEVENEMKTLTKGYADSPAMFIKSPMVTEFLGLSRDMSFSESELESAIITHLQNSDGDGQRLCLRRATAAHHHRYPGLLHRPGILQLPDEMFCTNRPEDDQDHPSGRRTNGYVCKNV